MAIFNSCVSLPEGTRVVCDFPMSSVRHIRPSLGQHGWISLRSLTWIDWSYISCGKPVNPINHPQVITRYKPSPMEGLWHWVAHICSNWNSIVLGLRRSRWRSLLNSGLQSDQRSQECFWRHFSVLNSHKSPFSTYPWGHSLPHWKPENASPLPGLWNRQALGTKRKSWGASGVDLWES